MKKAESYYQKQIIKFLEEEYQAYVIKVERASKSGIPDLIVCIDGRFIGIEVKRPDSSRGATPLQELNIGYINQAGGLAFEARSVEEVKEYLEEWMN